MCIQCQYGWVLMHIWAPCRVNVVVVSIVLEEMDNEVGWMFVTHGYEWAEQGLWGSELVDQGHSMLHEMHQVNTL